MKTNVPSLGVLLVTFLLVVAGKSDEEQNYCQNDLFEASCSSDEVIQMEGSLFGRMELGSCIRKDYGFIGCKANVLNITDLLCSGRRSCSIRVPNEMLDATFPCPEDFKNYLWANYSCAKVVTPSTKNCYQAQTVTAQEGSIASVVTMETDCGSPRAPWHIEVGEGQRINITLTDFSYASGGATASNVVNPKCVAYATIGELNYRRTVTVCGRGKRVSHEYLSVSNKVKVILLGGTHSDRSRYFMLNYKAVGCPTLSAPPGGWVKPEGDKMIMGCDDTREKRKLECQDNQWIGRCPKCAGGGDGSDGEGNVLPAGGSTLGRKQKGSVRLSYDIAIILVTAIAGGIALVILCVGLICVRRSRNQRAARASTNQQVAAQYGAHDFTAQEDGNYTRKERDLTWNYDQYKMSENEYASIQERNSPPPAGNKTSGPFTEQANVHAHSKQLTDFRSQVPPAPPYSYLESANENNMNQYTESNSGGSRQYYVLDSAVVSPDT